ncbi:piggyBac transposable element-derived protein 4-like [Anthonomus grandis grandis]|uniref:piggyBac transposable element-derived protein 4-like n=1 Tax=Anthonomus grandis grandis TaxID=2921223 RepID=UPI002166B91C|nr:piggyBac transposable element-derived protein 4-like [Anthonomus grandis grandis]
MTIMTSFTKFAHSLMPYQILIKIHLYQAIDESMIRFKGRSSIRQYMPMKPIKRGYKVWVRSDETGFMSQFQIYTGKVSNLTEKSLGARVIKDLSRELVGNKHKLYYDNFCNSVKLQNSLLLEGIYACGTARKNRKNMPNDLRDDKHLKRGESDYRVSTGGIVALKWMDRKSVLFISNFHDPANLETASRRKKDGSKEDVECPSLVNDYNRHMGYVDKFDMLKSLYEIDRKSRKWWHRIFWMLICPFTLLLLDVPNAVAARNHIEPYGSAQHVTSDYA